MAIGYDYGCDYGVWIWGVIMRWVCDVWLLGMTMGVAIGCGYGV